MKLDNKYSGKNITVVGPNHTKTVEDLNWLLKVTDNNSVFTFKTDADGEFLKLSFTKAVLEKEVKVRNTRKRVIKQV